MTHWRDPSEESPLLPPDTVAALCPRWRKPSNAEEVTACNRIDFDLGRVVLMQIDWEIERAINRSGF